MIYDNLANRDAVHEATIVFETDDQEAMQMALGAVSDALNGIHEVQDYWLRDMRCMNYEGRMESFDRLDSPFNF